LLRLVGQEGVGNPTREARTEVEALARYLGEHAPGLEVPIQPLIVFTHPEAELVIAQPLVPVVPAKKLKTHLRSDERGRALPRPTLERLQDALPTRAARSE
jgi:hypothetical protein